MWSNYALLCTPYVNERNSFFFVLYITYSIGMVLEQWFCVSGTTVGIVVFSSQLCLSDSGHITLASISKLLCQGLAQRANYYTLLAQVVGTCARSRRRWFLSSLWLRSTECPWWAAERGLWNGYRFVNQWLDLLSTYSFYCGAEVAENQGSYLVP